jgi:hypothetical protein
MTAESGEKKFVFDSLVVNKQKIRLDMALAVIFPFPVELVVMELRV